MTSGAEQLSTTSETRFERIADFITTAVGTPFAFGLALLAVVAWAIAGPFAGFSTTWQLIINSFTTIVTFLMVFLLGNASNRITENQERLLYGIYNEELRLHREERLVRRLVAQIDKEHIRPILERLDRQDEALEAAVQRLLDALSDQEQTG